MKELPLFPVTTVGSWPRSSTLLRAQRQKQRGQISRAEFDKIADTEVREVLRRQENAEVDLVTDGEQRRDNFYSFVTEKLSGVQLMTLAEMLEVVEDKAGFERILETLDVPAFAISNPTCVGPVKRLSPLTLDEYLYTRSQTDRPIKVTLPGPYLLTRAMWVKEVAQKVYPSKEALGEDVVNILQTEIQELIQAGADFIQLDEPVLTELVFTSGQTRTFMCAALSARADPTEELEFAVSLINRVMENTENVRTGLHICRGNWSQKESTLLSGSYFPLVPYLSRLKVQQLVLEYATPRAGELAALLDSPEIRAGKELGLGVVNPRTPQVEPSEAIVERVREALQYLPAGKVFLNPDCGFGTFSNRPINSGEVASAKLKAMVEAATVLRQEIAAPAQ
ncbi:MAG: cobalamin-independent methionine synthase II family protein [Chloroflexi bacterium]|nr:cobalamin-independent methionine synthase II family protein [Chloroflexota bacterium]OJV89547.1 MAG: vitamin-B12 independent methionine synthase [Chloroflexi bacterium 54-19]